MPRPASKADWRRPDPDTARSGSRFVRRAVFTLFLVTMVAVLIWWLLPPSYPEARFVSLAVTEYDIELSPIAVFPEDIDRFGESSHSKEFQPLDKLQTSEAIGQLDAILGGILSGDNVLVLYVAADGVSDKGVPYLLCSDFLREEGVDGADFGRHKLVDFLEDVAACPAELKLVILDVGHIAADPRAGMVVNEFPRLLAEAVKKIEDPSLWVLSSNHSLETTHVSHAAGRSIFSHYVSRGLHGDADKAGDDDNKVELDELARFVRAGVADWVSAETDSTQSQTPQLLHAGVGVVDVDSMTKPVFLQLVVRDDTKEENGDDKAKAKAKAKEKDKDAESRANTRGTRGLRLASYAEPSAQAKPPESGAEQDDAQSPDADDEASGAPLPAQDDPADKPNEADERAKPEPVEPERAKAESVQPKPANGEPDNSRVRQLLDNAWKVRDQMQSRGSADSWSPVDYAPHFWREYEALLLGYESRYRYGAVLDEKLVALEDLAREGDLASHRGSDDVLGRLADAQSEFLAGDAKRGFDEASPGLEAVAEAIKLQNDLLFALPYYVRWHACQARVASGDRSLGQTLKSLLDELADLVDLIESLSTSMSASAPSSVSVRSTLAELQRRTEELRALRYDVENRRLEAEALDLLDDSAKRGAAVRIEAVLSTPLLGADLRMKLLDTLEEIGGDTPVSPESVPSDRVENKSLADRKSTWDALREQADLEMKLVLLADPDHQFSLEPRDFSGVDEAKLWEKYGQLGGELGAFYRGLPSRIHALVEGNVDSGRDTGRPRRLIRLVDARDVRRTLGRSLTDVSLPGVDWLRLKTVRPILVAPPTLTLIRDDWVSLELTLGATDGQVGEVSYRLDYEPAQLRLEKINSRQWYQVSLGDADRKTLNLRVRCDKIPSRFDPIVVQVRVGDEQAGAREVIQPRLPPPDVVDLVVERITGRASSSAGEAARMATVLVDDPEASVILCRTFSKGKTPPEGSKGQPTGSTEYRMALVNRSGRARTVVVDLLAARKRLPFTVSLRPEPFDQYGRLASAFTRLADPLEVELPADESLTLFPDQKPAEETAADTPAPPEPPAEDPSADAPDEGPLVTHGVLCLIRDEASGDEWSRWIDFSPVSPREYLQADVAYSHTRRKITIQLAPYADSPVLPPLDDENPIVVEWETEGVLLQGTTGKNFSGRLTNVEKTIELRAEIDPEQTRVVEVRLAVNGYPRAFVFQQFTTSRDMERAEINSDLRRVTIMSPEPFAAFLAPLESSLTMKVQVDAPTDAFHNSGDVFEVGIDRNDDRVLGDDEKHEFYNDRQVEIRMPRVGPGGIVEVITTVQDYEIDLDPGGLADTRADLKAELRLEDMVVDSKSVRIVLDGTPPEFDSLVAPRTLAGPGAEIKIRARISDLSGVKSVQFGFDTNHTKTLDDDEKLEELFDDPNAGAEWVAILPTEDLKPNRVHTLIVQAVDRAGLSTKKTHDMEVGEAAVGEPAAGAPAPVAPSNSILRGRIYLSRIDEKISWTGADVWLEENGRHAKPDSSGRFTFDNLPPGDYTVKAKGNAGGYSKAGEGKVTLTEKPGEIAIQMAKPER